jgi:thiol-disulfide isomerase/thioredoxin
VPFVVELREGMAFRARADANQNGDLADDADLKLSLSPGDPRGRSFLVDLRWTARQGQASVPVQRLVRVVVPQGGTAYRIQDVYGMLGSLDVQGRQTLVLLYDANRDGLYAIGDGDGIFVDADGDRHFPIEVMAPEFGPFGQPFTLGRESVVVEAVEADGSRLTMRPVGPAVPPVVVEVGAIVPDLTFTGVDGKVRLVGALRGKPLVVYFWASWCASCRTDAEGLQALYARLAPDRLEILAVSYDVESSAMEQFRQRYNHTWPCSFSGGVPASDPMGRAFHESETGVYYLVDADGRLVTRVTDLAELNERLTPLLRR